MKRHCPRCAAFQHVTTASDEHVRCEQCGHTFSQVVENASPPAQGILVKSSKKRKKSIHNIARSVPHVAGPPMAVSHEQPAPANETRNPSVWPWFAVFASLIIVAGAALTAMFFWDRTPAPTTTQVVHHDDGSILPHSPADKASTPNKKRNSGKGVRTKLPQLKKPPGDLIVPPMTTKANGGKSTKRPGRLKMNVIELDFLNSKATGKRFAIIADRSGSMQDPVFTTDPRTGQLVPDRRYVTSIDLLHEEMIKTLKKLKPGTQYYISFFDEAALPMPHGTTWLDGGKDDSKVRAWIRGVRPGSTTKPLASFRQVFALEPRPDVIFFMTDGIFTEPGVADEIAKLNQGDKKVVINTIHFDNRGPLATTMFVSSGRYGWLLRSYKFPPPVQARLQQFARGTGNVAAGIQEQLEEISLQSGGTFTHFGPERTKIRRDAILAEVGELTKQDRTYRFRPRCHYHVHHVRLTKGTTYQIDLIGEFDTYLYLADDKGRHLVTNNNTGLSRNSSLIYRPLRTGDYRIIVTTNRSQRTGSYVVTVVPK